MVGNPDWIGEITALVRSHYVSAQYADAVADEIEARRDNGSYDGLGSAALADALSRDLRALTGDMHFSVSARPLTADEAATPVEHRWKHSMPGAEQNFGFEGAEVIEGGIAVLTITSLTPLATSRATAHAAMAFVRPARALVIDLRRCGGGDPDLIAELLSYLLGDQPVELTQTTWRHNGEVEGSRTDPSIVPFRFGPHVPVFVVVGAFTASGAEGLAYELQVRGRAVVVGQTTIGAAHRTMLFDIASSMIVNIPSGETTNPITGGNWEGIGVRPSVEVGGDGDARRVALDLAREATKPSRVTVADDQA